jgi:two-component system, cell cycle response regulator
MTPGMKNDNTPDARGRGRILLITDSPMTIPVGALETSGMEIVGVANGAAALISLQRTRPHLVIADESVQGISERELGRMLMNASDKLPLILVGKVASTVEQRQKAFETGAFDYFQLPTETYLLVYRVVQLVRLQQTLEELRAAAELDSLTGLANRRRFRSALSGEVERWRRYGVPCALLLLDIDYLKKINDNFGHPAGDLVIRHIARVLTEVSRDNDTAARLGGEEFALLLASINEEKAAIAAERLRRALAEHEVPDVGRVSVSIGVAACPVHATSERALYEASDEALYQAKNQGRNRVAVAPLLQEKLPGV